MKEVFFAEFLLEVVLTIIKLRQNEPRVTISFLHKGNKLVM